MLHGVVAIACNAVTHEADRVQCHGGAGMPRKGWSCSSIPSGEIATGTVSCMLSHVQASLVPESITQSQQEVHLQPHLKDLLSSWWSITCCKTRSSMQNRSGVIIKHALVPDLLLCAPNYYCNHELSIDRVQMAVRHLKSCVLPRKGLDLVKTFAHGRESTQ